MNQNPNNSAVPTIEVHDVHVENNRYILWIGYGPLVIVLYKDEWLEAGEHVDIYHYVRAFHAGHELDGGRRDGDALAQVQSELAEPDQITPD